MKKNIGITDRLIRLGMGIILLILAYWKGGGWISWTLVAIAAFMIFEAAFSWCLYYHLIGKNTCPYKKKGE